MRALQRTRFSEAQRYYREIVLAYDGDDCLPWPFGNNGAGYGTWGRRYVHRLVCEAVNGPPATLKHQAAHSCGKGHLGCVAKRHLSWKTRAQNEADKITHGTDNRGERHGMAKLTEVEVHEILALKGVVSQRAIAERFFVNASLISLIHGRKLWSHVV